MEQVFATPHVTAREGYRTEDVSLGTLTSSRHDRRTASPNALPSTAVKTKALDTQRVTIDYAASGPAG